MYVLQLCCFDCIQSQKVLKPGRNFARYTWPHLPVHIDGIHHEFVSFYIYKFSHRLRTQRQRFQRTWFVTWGGAGDSTKHCNWPSCEKGPGTVRSQFIVLNRSKASTNNLSRSNWDNLGICFSSTLNSLADVQTAGCYFDWKECNDH